MNWGWDWEWKDVYDSLEELENKGYETPNGDVIKPLPDCVKNAREVLKKLENDPRGGKLLLMPVVDIDFDRSVQVYWRNDEKRRALVCGCYPNKVIFWYFDILNSKNDDKWEEDDINLEKINSKLERLKE
jgi:hypothetical protein